MQEILEQIVNTPESLIILLAVLWIAASHLPRIIGKYFPDAFASLPGWLRSLIVMALPSVELYLDTAWRTLHARLERSVNETTNEADNVLLADIDEKLSQLIDKVDGKEETEATA